jgi:hypothetical protein
MNLYFLLEGKRTEKKVYPQWLSYLLPQFKQVKYFDEVVKYNYFLFSSNGYPYLLDDIVRAAQDINSSGKYSHLIICVDADEATTAKRKEEILAYLLSSSIGLEAELVIIVQNICFETWFLGNRRVFSRNPQDKTFKEYSLFYNVSTHDPEQMPNFPGFGSTSQFHMAYLKRMLLERGIRYTKNFPGDVEKPPYIKELQKRVADCPCHLISLQEFFSFCKKINLQ